MQVTRLIYFCDTWLIYICDSWLICIYICCWTRFQFSLWLIYICDMWLIYICDMWLIYIRDTWLIHAFDNSCSNPPAPMNHVKIFKGCTPRDAPSKLVQLWYKTFPPDSRGLVEMKNPTRLSNKTSTAWSCAEDQILESKNLWNIILNICTGR